MLNVFLPVPSGFSRCSSVLAVVLLALCLSGPAVADDRQIQGRVADADGDALAELELRLFAPDAPAFTADHVLATAATDSDGAFALETDHAGDVLLKIIGDDGAGRVLVTEDEAADALSLTYPVRTKIWLLHDNDLHFTFNYLGDFRDEVNRYRERYANVFLLNAGDIFVRHEHRWFEPEVEHYYRRAAGMILLMNAIGYDVVTPGNHEMDYFEHYTRKALEMAEFPLLAANMEVSTDKLPQFEDYAVVHTDNGYSLAVLGLSTGGGMDGISRNSPFGTAREYRHLADEHDLFIALTHIGLDNERRLAEEVPELDVIVGGHSHTLLEEAEMVGDVLVAQAGGHPHQINHEVPKYLGKIRLVLENGRVVEKEGHVIRFDGDD